MDVSAALYLPQNNQNLLYCIYKHMHLFLIVVQMIAELSLINN